MDTVFIVYTVSKGLDDTTNILGVFKDPIKAENCLVRAFQNISKQIPCVTANFIKGTRIGHIIFEHQGEMFFYLKEYEINKDLTLH